MFSYLIIPIFSLITIFDKFRLYTISAFLGFILLKSGIVVKWISENFIKLVLSFIIIEENTSIVFSKNYIYFDTFLRESIIGFQSTW